MLVSFPPLYLILGFMVFAVAMIFSWTSPLILRESLLARWCFGFLLISGVWFLFQTGDSEIGLQELRTRILSISFILVLLCVFRSEDEFLWARWAIFTAVLVAIGLNIYELFNPLTFSEVMGRSAGLYINPNISGLALMIGLILTIGLLRQRYRLLFAVVVGAAIFTTFSRAAIVGWLITVIILIKRGQISLRRSLVIGCGILAVSSILIVAAWDQLQYRLEDLGVLNSNVIERAQWFNKPVAEDDSAIDRHDVAEIALEKFSDRPLFGNGVGASLRLLMVHGGLEISSHNQYLNLMVDHGILGVFILPLLVLALIWRSRGEARDIAITLGLPILFMGFFSHNLLEERYILLPLALVSMMSLASRRGPRVETPKPVNIVRKAA